MGSCADVAAGIQDQQFRNILDNNIAGYALRRMIVCARAAVKRLFFRRQS